MIPTFKVSSNSERFNVNGWPAIKVASVIAVIHIVISSICILFELVRRDLMIATGNAVAIGWSVVVLFCAAAILFADYFDKRFLYLPYIIILVFNVAVYAFLSGISFFMVIFHNHELCPWLSQFYNGNEIDVCTRRVHMFFAFNFFFILLVVECFCIYVVKRAFDYMTAKTKGEIIGTPEVFSVKNIASPVRLV